MSSDDGPTAQPSSLEGAGFTDGQACSTSGASVARSNSAGMPIVGVLSPPKFVFCLACAHDFCRLAMFAAPPVL